MSEEHRNQLGQPIGAPLPGWTPRPLPPRSPIEGRFCRVEPLDPERHAEELFAANAEDREGRNWTYLPQGPFAGLEDYRNSLVAATRRANALAHAIIARDSSRAVGVASYLAIVPEVGSIEVGSINYSPQLQRKPAATEAMFLLMRRVFDELGYRRYEWKCDSLNAPSRAAAQRLGFRYEGLFRQATVYKGRNRDTAWFSITDQEWPPLHAAFERWLDPANFDAAGHQRLSSRACVNRDLANGRRWNCHNRILTFLYDPRGQPTALFEALRKSPDLDLIKQVEQVRAMTLGAGDRATMPIRAGLAGAGPPTDHRAILAGNGPDMSEASGRTALVTGGGGGIGRAIARRLAQDGMAVAVLDRDGAAAQRTAAELGGFAVTADVTAEDAVAGAVEPVIARFGRIDVLVNNAGICWTGPALDMPLVVLRDMLRVNVEGVFIVSRAVLPHMVARRSGSVVNLASWAGKTGNAWFAGYSASKFAVVGLTQALAREMAPHGIRVNAICPGIVVDTAMRTALEAQQRQYGLPETEERAKAIPLGRLSVPDDVARVAAFLASEEAAYITGESINLSGGLLMD